MVCDRTSSKTIRTGINVKIIKEMSVMSKVREQVAPLMADIIRTTIYRTVAMPVKTRVWFHVRRNIMNEVNGR